MVVTLFADLGCCLGGGDWEAEGGVTGRCGGLAASSAVFGRTGALSARPGSFGFGRSNDARTR